MASYVKTIEGLLKRTFHVERLVFDRNSNGKIGQLVDLALYRFKIAFSSQFDDTDVVFANHFNLYWKVLFKKIRKGQTLVIHWHGSELYGSARFRNVDEWRKNEVFKDAIHIVPSEYFRREVLKQFPELEKVEVVPSGGIDTDVFMPVKKEGREELLVGFAGHLNKEKGADFLLNLARDKQQLERELGKKISLKALKYGVKDENLLHTLETAGVRLLSPIPKGEMPKFYNALDVLLFPTRRKSESLGLVPLEAMSCNVPVVCPDDFACPEYCISGVSGELYQPENMDNFKLALNKVVLNLVNYSPRKVILENYAQDKVAEKYAEVISGRKFS